MNAAATGKGQFGAVPPENTPAPRRRRPDPDATAVPPPPVPATDAPTPAPTEAAEHPAAGQTPARPTTPAPTGQGLLASVLASSPAAATPGADTGPNLLVNLARMRRKALDPMEDYAADGTRMLRWVQAAIAHFADLTGRTQQAVLRDALLGTVPIPPELLDAHFQEQYGYPRSEYRPPT